MYPLPLFSLLLANLVALSTATPYNHHVRQAFDEDNPELSDPAVPPKTLNRPDRGVNPFPVADMRSTPESCTDMWKPSEDCLRDLEAQMGTDEGVVGFGGGEMKWDSDHQCSDEQQGKLMTAAWDARILAIYGETPPTPGGEISTWRAWMGPNFLEYQERINNNLKRVGDFLIRKKFDIILSCKDTRNRCGEGADGKTVGGYAWTYNGWFGKYYYITMCPVFFRLDDLETTQDTIERDLARGETKYAREADWQKNTGQYFLHEMMHLDSIGDPHINDEGVQPDIKDPKAYGPYRVHQLARRPLNQGGGAARASTNADSYAWLVNSLYFYELTTYFPQPPKYKASDADFDAAFSGDHARWESPYSIHLGEAGPNVTEDDFHARFNTALEEMDTPDPVPQPVGTTNPDDLPQPKCAGEGLAFSVGDVEGHIREYCDMSDQMWDTVITPPISTGTGATSDGKSKAIGSYGYYDLPGREEKFWTGIMFSRDTCSGYFTLGRGSTREEKTDYCVQRMMRVLHGCHIDTTTEKRGGQLEDGCAVYTITVAKDDPFDNWYGEVGDLECEDAQGSAPGLENACSCWWSNYPGLTDLFEKPEGGCDPVKVNRAKQVNGP